MRECATSWPLFIVLIAMLDYEALKALRMQECELLRPRFSLHEIQHGVLGYTPKIRKPILDELKGFRLK